ncbi:MAG: hypothetical protein U0269_07290 [Polyangiales bacterium]
MNRRWLTVVMLAALSGCAGTQVVREAPRPRTARDYLPLRANAAWSYDARDQTRAGVATLVTLRVERQDGETFVVNQGGRTTSIYSYAQGGVLRNAETILADPIVRGTSWQGNDGDTYTIREVGLRRETPAGTFNEVIEVVRTGRADFVERAFYAPGVGMIESTSPVVIDHEIHQYRLLLRGYTLDGEL